MSITYGFSTAVCVCGAAAILRGATCLALKSLVFTGVDIAVTVISFVFVVIVVVPFFNVAVTVTVPAATAVTVVLVPLVVLIVAFVLSLILHSIVHPVVSLPVILVSNVAVSAGVAPAFILVLSAVISVKPAVVAGGFGPPVAAILIFCGAVNGAGLP